MAGLQFALSLQYLAFGHANSVASLTSSLSPSPIQSFWAQGPSVRPWGRETWAPRLPHRSKGHTACTFLGYGEKYEILRKPEQDLVPNAEGPGAVEPGTTFGSVIYQQRGPLSLSICKICSFFLGLLCGLNELACVKLRALCEHLMNARHYCWYAWKHGWVETDTWLGA